MPIHKMVLSTTKPNNHVPLIRIIQDDKNSQIFEAEMIEEGKLLDFDGKIVFFNAQIGPYKVRDKVESVDYKNSRVSYTLIDAFLQKVGEFEAWFSFADSDAPESDLFSTMKFAYKILPGIRKNIWEGNYFWDLKELVDYYQRYKNIIANIIENEDFSGLVDKIVEIEGKTSQIDNFATATKVEAEQGMAANKFMTPQRVTQQTDARLATIEEAQEGTNSTKLMTPTTTSRAIEKKAVTITGDQDVTGKKNFIEAPTFKGKSLALSSTTLIIESGFKNETTGWVKMQRFGEIVIISYSLSPKANTGTWMTIIPIGTIVDTYLLNQSVYSVGAIASSEVANANCVVGMNEVGLQFGAWNRPSGTAAFTGQIVGIAKNK
ncbi:BppU family phage baseplate upper protein [Enterococcus thailandicus]|uniref:BppU family phage baseplate upper protein n=1 Tax=Enterococcus thailandicus TaxID=417368 RepID=UPI0039A67E8F